ncbi:hypothetical protein [Tropicimonas aquimaris]|uniref:Uncharacterized protein n=1 Tax=Tropicimonas aquimaris TaxID=914152 RepID=A0ABW3INS2_9RHOB
MISDTNGLLDAVRRQVGDQTAQILSLDRKGFEDGFADAVTGGDGVNRHSGIARTSSGEVEFKLVAKTCAEFSQGANPSSWLYWKREPLAYESGLLDALCGLAAPRCFGFHGGQAGGREQLAETHQVAHESCNRPRVACRQSRLQR